MSVTKSSVCWLMALCFAGSSVTRAQDFEALLQDLTLPSPTALAATAEADVPAPAPVEEAPVEPQPEAPAEAITPADDALFDEILNAPAPAAASEAPVESAPVPVEADPFASPVEESAPEVVVETVPAEEPFIAAPAPEAVEAAAEEILANQPEAPAMAVEDFELGEIAEPPALVEEAAPAAVEEAPVVEAVVEPAVVETVPSAEPVAAVVQEPEVVAEPVEEPAPVVEAVVEPEVIAAEPAPVVEAEPEPVPVVEAEPAADVGAFFDFAAPADEPAVEPAAAAAEPVAAETDMAAAEPVVEEAPAEVPEPISPDATGLDPKLVAAQEEVRRQAREVEGRQSAERGFAAAQAGDWDAAITALTDAQLKVPARAPTTNLLAQVRASLGAAHLQKAGVAFERGEHDIALESLRLAGANGADPREIESLTKKISKAQERKAAIAAKPVPVKERKEIVDRVKSTQELIIEGRQYFNVRDYDAAEALFEEVLKKDEYNVDAMRFLRKIDEVRYKIRTKAREATAADLIQKVRETWTTPLNKDVKLPDAVVKRGPVETQTATQRLQEKMERIIIPSIEFRQANITDVINFLVEASILGDPDKAGVNIILNLNIPGGGGGSAPTPVAAAPTPAPAATDDPFGFGGDFGGGGDFAAPAQDMAQPMASPDPGSSIPTITLNLRRITLLDAIKYITEVARLKYRLEENAVIITPEGVVSGRVVTRLYPVQPSIQDVIIERGEAVENAGGFTEIGAKSAVIKKSDVKDFFEKTGVPFPAGTSITYNPAISQLIVANTPENLETFERILARLNVIPNQVEIEARFVEISQDDLEELGFQWLLTDNWEIAQKTGPFGIGSAERIQMNSDPDGVTKGLRFFTRNNNTGTIEPSTRSQFGTGVTPLGGIATFASILTNPEVALVIQAISQHGGTDLLSAPRVTTRSGVNAQIQVVREILYPTEFEITQPQFNESGNVTTPPVVTPGSFEKRETGVILNVTPTVGPDGYTIDLVLVPEVSELVEWLQYGSTVSIPRLDALTGLFTGDQTFTFNIPQPVFSSRNVTTSIVIWDGQTVVMGGLIREDLVKVKDKVPFLGDIPLLGRLFRSEGEYSRKKNLLIFVTARLVDPSGKPINRGGPVEAEANAGGAAATP